MSKVEFIVDERFIDHDKVWGQQITQFDLYDFVGQTTVPLNYDESQDWSHLQNLIKKVLLVPLESEGQTVIMVPQPQQQSADMYILEIPRTTMLDESGEEVYDPNKAVPLYMADPFTQQNTTIFLYESRF